MLSLSLTLNRMRRVELYRAGPFYPWGSQRVDQGVGVEHRRLILRYMPGLYTCSRGNKAGTTFYVLYIANARISTSTQSWICEVKTFFIFFYFFVYELTLDEIDYILLACRGWAFVKTCWKCVLGCLEAKYIVYWYMSVCVFVKLQQQRTKFTSSTEMNFRLIKYLINGAWGFICICIETFSVKVATVTFSLHYNRNIRMKATNFSQKG